MTELVRKLEALLFASGKKLNIEELMRFCNADKRSIKKALATLDEEHKSRDTSIMLIQEGESYKLNIKEEYIPIIQEIVTETELPKTVMETLAVIAFKHPILQADLIKIRTNKAYEHLKELEEAGFIARELFGRTKKIKLTQKFFDYFDLPPEKMKQAFAAYEAVEKMITDKESTAMKLKEQLDKAKGEVPKEKLGDLEVIDEQEVKTEEGESLPQLDESIEVVDAENPEPEEEPEEVNEDVESRSESLMPETEKKVGLDTRKKDLEEAAALLNREKQEPAEQETQEISEESPTEESPEQETDIPVETAPEESQEQSK